MITEDLGPDVSSYENVEALRVAQNVRPVPWDSVAPDPAMVLRRNLAKRAHRLTSDRREWHRKQGKFGRVVFTEAVPKGRAKAWRVRRDGMPKLRTWVSEGDLSVREATDEEAATAQARVQGPRYMPKLRRSW